MNPSDKKPRARALQFGKVVLRIHAVYAGSFVVAAYTPFIWDLLIPTPLCDLSDPGIANSNFFVSTSFWVALQSAAICKSKDYDTIKRALAINAFGFASWFGFDIFHYFRHRKSGTNLFFFGLVPVTITSLLLSLYAYKMMADAKDEE